MASTCSPAGHQPFPWEGPLLHRWVGVKLPAVPSCGPGGGPSGQSGCGGCLDTDSWVLEKCHFVRPQMFGRHRIFPYVAARPTVPPVEAAHRSGNPGIARDSGPQGDRHGIERRPVAHVGFMGELGPFPLRPQDVS